MGAFHGCHLSCAQSSVIGIYVYVLVTLCLKRKGKKQFNGIVTSIKTCAPELQYVHWRGLVSASIPSWKLSNKLPMDIVTIYYRYSIWRLTWDIKKLKQNIFSPVNLIWPFNYLQYMRLQEDPSECTTGKMALLNFSSSVNDEWGATPCFVFISCIYFRLSVSCYYPRNNQWEVGCATSRLRGSCSSCTYARRCPSHPGLRETCISTL